MLLIFSKASIIFLMLMVLPATAEPEVFLVRGFPEESDELKLDLARSSKPIWVIQEKNSSISELIQETCGTLSPKVNQKFVEQTIHLNGFKNEQAVVRKGLAVAVPFCSSVKLREEVVVGKGDTVSEILKTRTGVFGKKTIRHQISSMGGFEEQTISDGKVEQISRSIRPGDRFKMAYASPQRLFRPLKNTLPPQLLIAERLPKNYEVGVAERLVVPLNSDKIENVVSNSSYPDIESLRLSSRASEIKMVDLVSLEAVESDGGCGMLDAVAPFGQIKYMAVIDKQISILESKGITPTKTRVGIIDSGLALRDESFFKPHHFAINLSEKSPFAKENFDDDWNQFKDDILGINFEREPNRISPFPWADYRKRAHGTNVASLIIGGTDYVEDPNSKLFVELVVVNFGRRGGGLQDASSLLTAIDYLSGRNASIVNMSLSTDLALHQIPNKSDVLFVSAAGNRSNDVLIENRYPARFGGYSNTTNVITVGALNHIYDAAKFTNFGTNVDLYATGCNLKVVDHKGARVSEHGSSMSAGVVTFVSAVIQALSPGEISPKQIKDRLASSADYVANFYKGKEASLLNPYKAVSLFQDVVEIVDLNGSKSLFYGQLTNIDVLRQACNQEDLRERLNGIKKVTPNIDRNGEIFVRYLLKPEGGGQGSVECAQNENFVLAGESLFDFNEIEIDRITDIVVANYR
ncbi:S8 family serine peptidase [Shewanella sp. 10N.286.52.B9]|uniref:S8 family serine peptidase n=1 Tax=Shewanella sp. 10N.286.52.B9 TaxID=1880837 RepID=UPI000C842C04|nr:S8 family serine peptidase [Shewanella sp. 10N.286.52.B9]PMG43401.1 hypothetical protein BCU91_00450 [Shewanella sp. 10N.286.52.B9]